MNNFFKETVNLTPTEIEYKKSAVMSSITQLDKSSWQRKLRNMEAAIARLSVIEEEILKLHDQKTPIMDEIASIRAEMVLTCVHPYEHLVVHEGNILCKFCNKKFNTKG